MLVFFCFGCISFFCFGADLLDFRWRWLIEVFRPIVGTFSLEFFIHWSFSLDRWSFLGLLFSFDCAFEVPSLNQRCFFFCRVAWLVHHWSLLAGVCWNFQSCVSGPLSALNFARRSSASSIITTRTAASVVYPNSNTHDLAPIALLPLPNPSIANSTRR